jgi:large subunit ribosomal protein L29
MRSSDVRDLSDDELAVRERELRESLGILRLRFRTNQLESPARMGQTRRDIARIKTIQLERQHKAKGNG